MALAAALPLFLHPGFLNTRGGGDSPFLLFRLHQLTAALSEGVFPVRWMPDAAFGLGYPFFNYYAALPYYFAAAFRLFGLSYILSLKLTHLLGFAVASLGMYEWTRRTTGSARASFVAAAAYTLAPFHMVNVYVRGDSLSEFWAMAWYPLILLAVLNAAQRPSGRQITLVALTFGALVMTHNVSALIFSPFIGLYAVGCALASLNHRATEESSKRRRWEPIVRIATLAAGGILGLALAAWVWLPALAEQEVVQLGAQTTGYLFYGNHFRAENLIQPQLFFNYDTGTEGISPFSMGLVQAMLIITGALVLIYRMIRQQTWWRDGFFLVGLLLSTLMITPLSAPVWERAPLLPFTQFPWRFLSVQALFGAAIIAQIAALLSINGGRRVWSGNWLVETGLAMLLSVAAFGALRLNFIPLNDADVTPMRLQWYESFSGNIGTTIRYEYLPQWTNPRPYTSDILLQREPRAKFLSGEGSARRVASGAASQMWDVEVMGPGARIAIPLLYWPGWRAEIDGQPLPITPVDGIGYTQFDVPEGHHTVWLWLGRTPVRLWAEIASAAAIFVVGMMVQPQMPRLDWIGRTHIAGSVLMLIVLSMILHSLPEPAPLPGPLNADFSQEAYFHHSPGGVRFGEGSLLTWVSHTIEDMWLNYDIAWIHLTEEQPRGWQGLAAPPPQSIQGAEDSSYSSEPDFAEGYPLTSRDGRVWAQGETPGLYFFKVEVLEGAPVTQDGQNRGEVYFEPFVYPVGLNQATRDVVDGKLDEFGPLRLLDANGIGSGEGVIQVTLFWETLSEVTRTYSTSIRIYDSAGTEWGTLDTQTGSAGMYPTGLWSPGEVIVDNYWLPASFGIPPGQVYRIEIVIYDLVSGEVLGQTQASDARVVSVVHRACDKVERIPLFEEVSIQASAVESTLEQGDELTAEVMWVYQDKMNNAYQVRWSLVGPDGVAWTAATAMAPGSEPLSWDNFGSAGYCGLVLGKHHLDIPSSVPPGDYSLRLQLLSESGEAVGKQYTAGNLTITGRDRTFDIPPLETVVEAIFGDALRLWGYSLDQSSEALSLHVAWGTLADPAVDYKYFVHLIDPETEQIVAQVDSMPRGYTYPTSQWIEGEIVEEIITLDLRRAPPGEYRIALGWYDLGTVTRLPAIDADGNALPDERVILPEIIRIP